ncbi:B3 domain-containing protein At1g05920-like [Neltuma alba]|uniref:B3 domain-containing protein At1g05920-like n=1 Tax=Neltuma alba TaxID=207710 RepID=UPI0010A58040|nr:B3 domain-containing protein At1g05920-like [Prosopis alba]
MSDVLTMEDFEGMEQSNHNLSSFEILLQVVSVAAKKYDLADINNENIEPNLSRNNVYCKRAQTELVKEKMKPLKFVIRRRHNEDQNLIYYAIKDPSMIHDAKRKSDDLIEAKGSQKLQESVINNSSRKTDTLKRKLEKTISNNEWIEAMEMKRKKNNKKQGSHQNPPPPYLLKEFERKIIDEYGGTRITRVIQKSLSSTDVSKGHSRVTIPCSQVESFRFLDDNEMTQLRFGQSITVPLIHTPRRNGVALPLIETSMEFGQWDLHKDKNDLQKVSYQYVLRTNWNTIVLRDELQQSDTVQIWAFRDVQNKLCMALIKL